MPSPDAILDLAQTSLASLNQTGKKYTQLATLLPKYHMYDAIKNGSKKIYAGNAIEQRVMYRDAGTARMTSLFATRPFFRQDIFTKVTVPWRNMIWSYFWDTREEVMNRGDAQIIDHIKAQRDAAYISAAKLMETQGFEKPTDSTDTESLWGYKYWITRATSTASDRFTGGVPSGFSDKGGLSPTTYDEWRNWSAVYSAVNEDDFVKLAKEAMMDTDWESPIDSSIDGSDRGMVNQILVGKALLLELERHAKQSNDQVGTNLTFAMGKTMIAGNAPKYCRHLDSDTQQPAYFINKNTFYFAAKQGHFFIETKPKELPDRPFCQGVDIGLMGNFFCDDLRKNGVLYKAA